ncbi:MAG: tetratricopeptide repeat protein [bacterium]|nr:tetratricopeptide repeat protein [bacterium]
MGRSPLPWILLLTLVCWSGSIARGGFAYDDREVLAGNPVVRGEVPATRAFTQDYWAHIDPAGHYRPLATLSLRLDHRLFGENALGYHLTNVVLHLLVVALAGLLLHSLYAEGVPWFGLALFAAHPALADAVAWMSGRTSMLSALGGLAAAVVIARHPGVAIALLASAMGVLASIAGKEDGVIFAPLCVLVAQRHSRRTAFAAGCGSLLALLVYATLRHAAIDQWLPAAPHAPLAGAPLLERAQQSGHALIEGLRVAALPLDYPPLYAVDAFTAGGRGLAALAWTWLFVLGAAGAWLLAHGRQAGGAALLICGAILPHMQVEPSGVLFAPRFLYLPLLFAAPLIGAAWRTVFPRRWAAWVLVVCVPLAWQRASVYASREAFWSTCLESRTDDPVVWNALGNARAERGNREAARAAWTEAVRIDPAYSRPLDNLGASFLEELQFEPAEMYLRRSVDVGPRNPTAHANLANLLMRTDRAEEAVALYEHAVTLAPGRAALWRGLANARSRAGDAGGAIAAIEKALELAPADAAARRLAERLRER